MSEAWPSPDAQPGPLPRIEDLPIADRGYEQEAVQAAFDAFYRHAAQLDATLRSLEAVEVFRRDADALRNDLRSIRALGGLGEREPAWATQTYERAQPEIPVVAIRLLAEAALIIAVAVIAGVSHLAATTIVLLMVAAFAVVAFSEWLAARARYVAPVGGFVSAELLEPAPYVEAPAPVAAEWGEPAVEPDEETEPEALTVIGAPAVDGWAGNVAGEAGDARPEDRIARGDPWEADAAAEPDDEPAAQGFFRRRRR
jgi:hypothetical protein